ncbi:MAG: long-chain fatty acid--CoA ligase, partial [Methanomicrobiales archaeon]|nr:long-chain fatty acid--CoA ligase [Methanomicrobiales archaeon]
MSKAHLNQVIASHLAEIKAEEDPGRPIYIFEKGDLGEDVVTYKDLYENSNKIARFFLDSGIGRGDTYAVFMRNHPEFVYSLLAGPTIGSIMVPIDPRSRGDRLRFLLKDCGAKAVIVSGECLEQLEEVVKDLPALKLVSVAYRPEQGIQVTGKYHALNEVLERTSWKAVEQQIMDVRHPMQIIYTSGTTGDPKGVAIRNNRTGLFNILTKI